MTKQFYHCPRLFYPLPLYEGNVIALPEGQSHYLKNVLRKDVGDSIRLFNQDNGEWVGKIESIGKKLISITIETQIKPSKFDIREIHLFFSPIKKDRNDMLIEKAVELGVTHFHPVLFARSIVRDLKPERIQAQMIEAAEQSERLSIPTLLPLKNFREALTGWDKNIPLFAAIERMDTPNLSQMALKTEKAGLCIGPEGGITPEEAEMLSSKTFTNPVSLGENILRVETAVFYGVSILSSKLFL